jgi:multidrug efflux system membrane fusion protein
MAPFNSADAHDAHTQATINPRSQTSGGSHWLIWLIVIAIVAVGIWFYRSRNTQNAATAAASDSSGAAGKGGRVAIPSVPVVVATATKGDLPVFFNGLGNVTAFNTVTVRSRVDGQIVKINFTEGQYVNKGESLIEIDSRPFEVQLEQAEGQLAKDQAQRNDAQINLERYKLLYQEGVIPKQQLDSQAASVGQFDGAIKSDQAQIDNAKLQIVYSHITAPISGRIGLRLVDMGNMVHATDANGLLVITQLQPISVLFSLPQDQLPQVVAKMHSAKALTVEAYDRDNTDKIATGKLLTIDNQIDATTGTYKLKATFDNTKNELFPNQFVNVHLLVDTKKNVVLVPTTAILRGPQGTYVFSVLPDKTVKVRTITIAETNGNVTGISSGLASGDVVVTDGQDKLQDGTKVDPRTPTPGGSHSANTAASSPFLSPGGGPAR